MLFKLFLKIFTKGAYLGKSINHDKVLDLATADPFRFAQHQALRSQQCSLWMLSASMRQLATVETLSKLLVLFWGLAVLQPTPLPHSYGTFSSSVISPSTLC